MQSRGLGATVGKGVGKAVGKGTPQAQTLRNKQRAVKYAADKARPLAELEADARAMIKTGKPLKTPALKALLRGWNQSYTERLPSGKHRHLKNKELIAKVKAEAELRFALDPGRFVHIYGTVGVDVLTGVADALVETEGTGLVLVDG